MTAPCALIGLALVWLGVWQMCRANGRDDVLDAVSTEKEEGDD